LLGIKHGQLHKRRIRTAESVSKEPAQAEDRSFSGQKRRFLGNISVFFGCFEAKKQAKIEGLRLPISQ
jgi:hypothetical protein